MNKLYIIVGALGLAFIGGGVWFMSLPPDGARPIVNAAMHGAGSDAAAPDEASVDIPKFSPVAMNGKRVFDENCAACHGANAVGTEQGPPLIHKIYEPGHHGDAAFVRAATTGVQSHHWRYGDMPAVEGVNENQVAWIIKYVREIQSANGIN